jgi:hypothetical protein
MHLAQFLKLGNMIICIAIAEPRSKSGPRLCDGILHAVNVDIELHIWKLSE